MNKETKKMIPELRFPEFVNDREWKIVPLDSVVVEFIVPMRDKPKNLNGLIPWCRIEDFDGMYLSKSKSNQGVSLDTIKEMNLKVYPINTLLVSCSADLGRCAITSKELVTNQTFIGLVPNIDRVNTVYLYYIMIDSKNELNARSSGTTISYLSRQEFDKFEIQLPKPQEQQKIASCLSSLDEVITAHIQKLEVLKTHKKGLMQNLFPQAGETIPKWRFKEFVNDGEWKINEFSNYIKLYRGSSPRPIQDYFTQNELGVNWIKIGDTKFAINSIISKVEEKITPQGAEKSRKVNKGELILANSMSFGKTYQLAIDGYIYDGWFVLREYEKHFYKPYLLQLLNSDYMQNQYSKFSAGGIVQNISSEIVYRTMLLHTSLPEQQKIADCLSSLDGLITAQTKKIEQLKLHKKGLMQGLFPKVND